MENLKELKLTPENTKLFEQTNPYHPDIIDLNKSKKDTGFSIIIDFETGFFVFVNSERKKNHVCNNHFEPNYIEYGLETIYDLHQLVKIFNGIGLTPIKISRCCGRCDGVHDICVADQICENHKERGCELCFGER